MINDRPFGKSIIDKKSTGLLLFQGEFQWEIIKVALVLLKVKLYLDGQYQFVIS